MPTAKTTNKRAGGRPPLPPEERLSKAVPLRMTEGDHARYVRASKILGESIASAARDGLERMVRRAEKVVAQREASRHEVTDAEREKARRVVRARARQLGMIVRGDS